ncbi:MAG: hypothetical protein EA397_14295 [Deltaproteobacteria bacterium]|nr:MAG: hypothetical protein EA397_14295 [Deltaproteobacteria bacterium]
MTPKRPGVALFEASRQGTVKASAFLLFSGFFVVLVPLLAGVLPLIPVTIILLASGAGLDALAGVLVFWGAAPLIASMSGLPAALCLLVAGLELYRLRHRGLAWAGLALAAPLGLVAGALQILLTPCTGIPTAVMSLALICAALIYALSVMNRLHTWVGFDAYRALRDEGAPPSRSVDV